jgi:transposase
LIEEGKAASEIADTFNVHVATIYRLAAAMDAVYPKTQIP